MDTWINNLLCFVHGLFIRMYTGSDRKDTNPFDFAYVNQFENLENKCRSNYKENLSLLLLNGRKAV